MPGRLWLCPGRPAPGTCQRPPQTAPSRLISGAERPSLLQSIARLAAWLVLAVLVLATLVPIGLRPQSGLSPQVERFLAFAVAGGLVALAYPRRPLLAFALVATLAIGLELAQFAAATRHPGLPDFLAKALGGAVGLAGGWGLNLVATALRARRPRA